jgi:hypothetical protein
MCRPSVCLVALILALLPGGAMAELYGAISYSTSTGMAGTAWNFQTGSLAETEAYHNCGYNDCDTLVVFTQCGAIAVGDGYVYGYGYDRSLNRASNIALQNCDGYTSNCQITAAFCNDGY